MFPYKCHQFTVLDGKRWFIEILYTEEAYLPHAWTHSLENQLNTIRCKFAVINLATEGHR